MIERVSRDARVPVIKHLDGICHVYVSAHADLAKAQKIAFNAKTYRYGICGAMETLLVDQTIAADFCRRWPRSFARRASSCAVASVPVS